MSVRRGWLPVAAGAGALVVSAVGAAQAQDSGAAGWQDKILGWARATVAAVPSPTESVEWFVRAETDAVAAADRALTRIKSYGPSFPMADDSRDAPATPGGINDAEKQSIGCIIGGSGGLATAVGVGGTNVVNLIAGGIVSPLNPAAAYLALSGVVFASFCAIGQALTPAALLAWDRFRGDESSPVGLNPGLPGRRPFWPIGPDGNWDPRLGYVVEVGGRDGERLLILTGTPDSR